MEKPVVIKKFDGSTWHEIYPKTTIPNVINLSTSLANMQADVDSKVPLGRNLDDAEDLNSIVTSGLYRLSNNHANMPGAIGEANYAQMYVSRGYDTVSQIVIAYNSQKMWYRGGYTSSGGGWTAWSEVVNLSTFNTALAGKVSTSRVFAGLDLTADRSVAAVKAALAYIHSDVGAQQASALLTALAGLGSPTGLVHKNGASTFILTDPGSIGTINNINMNGVVNQNPTFYAPVVVGTQFHLLHSNGSGAPVFKGHWGETYNRTLTSFTLSLSSHGHKALLVFDGTGSRTITIPLNSAQAFPIGTEFTIMNSSTGTTIITPASGVTLDGGILSYTHNVRHKTVKIVKINTDSWVTQIPDTSLDIAAVDDYTTLRISFNTSTSRTLALSDKNSIIFTQAGGATTITVPPDSSVAFAVGTEIRVMRYNSQEVTIGYGSGVSIYSEGNSAANAGKRRINLEYQVVTLKKTASNTWVLFGSLKT